MHRKCTKLLAALCWVVLGCAPADEELPARAGSDTAAAAAAGAVSDSAVTTVRVTLDEWSIGVSQSSIPAGQIRFAVQNHGEYEHALEVEGQGSEQETRPIPGGGSDTLTADLKPGTYELYCPIDDTHGKHEELGMRATLVVQ